MFDDERDFGNEVEPAEDYDSEDYDEADDEDYFDDYDEDDDDEDPGKFINFSKEYPGQSFSVAAEFERLKSHYEYMGDSEESARSKAQLKISTNYLGVDVDPEDSDMEKPKIKKYLADLEKFAKKKPEALELKEEIYALMEVHHMSMERAYKEACKRYNDYLFNEE